MALIQNVVKNGLAHYYVHKKSKRAKTSVLLLKRKGKEFRWPCYNSSMKIKLPTKYTRPELTSLKSKRIKKYVKKPWDPTTTPAAYNNETRARYITQLNRFANNKLKEYIEYVFRQKSLRMEKLCLQLVKHLFYNMANTHSELNKNVMDWEYVLLHAHQIGVPPEVIRNVQKKMTRKTKREKPALSAFNKPREPLIDLTASDD